jgi:hypothetical protein
MNEKQIDPMLFAEPGLKRCPRCGLTKSLSNFAARHSSQWNPSSYCRPCQREYCRGHYRNNKDTHNKRRLVHQRVYIIRNKKLMNEYLSSRACVDCGNSNPVVLEFDHVRGKKKNDVSTMACRGFSWATILEEVAKCEIRCANCHRIRTAAHRYWKGPATLGIESVERSGGSSAW